MKSNFLAKSFLMSMVLCLCLVFTTVTRAETEISYFSWGLAEKIWGGWLKETGARYEKEHPQVKIELQSTTFADKDSVYTTRCQAGICPDIAEFTFDPLPLFVKKGFLMNLTPFVEKEGPEFIKTWNERAIATLTVDGNLYGMPGTLMPWVLVYNTQMFEKAGLDPSRPPKTMDELLKYAKALTKDTDGDGKVDQWGFGMTAKRTMGLFSRFNGFLWSSGGDYLTPNLAASALNSPEALEGIKFFVELHTKHKVVHPGPVEMGPHDVRIALANEKVAMSIGTGFTPGIVNGINPKLKALDVLRFASFPSYGNKSPLTSATLSMRVVSARTKHPQATWELLKYMANFENELSTWDVNGWVSARKDVAKDEKIVTDKFGRVLAENQIYVHFPPAVEEWPEIADIVITALQNSLTGIQTPEEALLEAHNRINPTMKK